MNKPIAADEPVPLAPASNGDWIKFLVEGEVVIMEVGYVGKGQNGPVYWTDRGSIDHTQVVEIRPKWK